MRLLIAAACVVPAILSIAQSTVSAKLDGRAVDLRELLFSGGDWLLLGPLIPFAFAIARRFPRRRIAVHIAAALALAIVWASCGMLLGAALERFPAVPPLGGSYLRWIAITIPFAALIYLATVGAAEAYRYFVTSREQEEQLATARLSALRMQLRPHFLFNTLNSALVVVRDGNTVAAAEILERLSELLREAIRTDRPNEIPLRDELRFLEQYLAIEQVRFADRLNVTWSIDERTRDALVPDFILQPLVENAIRHGFARSAEASTIAIDARVVDDMLELSVTDDGAGFDPASTPFGIGLTNTRERLRTLYGSRGTLALSSKPAESTRAIVRLPFRT